MYLPHRSRRTCNLAVFLIGKLMLEITISFSTQKKKHSMHQVKIRNNNLVIPYWVLYRLNLLVRIAHIICVHPVYN